MHGRSVVIAAFSWAAFVATGNPGPLVPRLIRALDRTLDALGARMDSVFADVALGLRVANDQLEDLISSTKLHDSLSRELQDLKRKSGRLADQAVALINTRKAGYDMEAKAILRKGLWRTTARKEAVPKRRPQGHPGKPQRITEKSSGRCFNELTPGCQNISRHCWDLMTTSGGHGYEVTHQVLYLAAGQGLGCTSRMESMDEGNSGSTVDVLLKQFCSVVADDALESARQGFQPSEKMDLFLEQVAVCGARGVAQLLWPPWVNMALSWQKPNGCFHRPHDTANKVLRTRRSERVTADGCLLHMTSVATGALAVWLRSFLRQAPPFV
ncbi:UPF0764 protein C16orf89 homolog [Ornithodoros turicata]|uniref:UPF0764 protein C16orf89 homolog n=1 Tax=Ornithodoros turicata TaxID=34597 RepID=UPI0031398BDD